MIIVFKKKATKGELEKVAKDLDGYIKFVVDIDREILSAGGEMHADGERLLLEDGSNQSSLWGGGLDLTSGEIDYNSMINLRPAEGNLSRDVLDISIRGKMEEIVKKLLL